MIGCVISLGTVVAVQAVARAVMDKLPEPPEAAHTAISTFNMLAFY